MIDLHLSGKVVFITGANHGIGAATARTFARQGADVFITYYRGPTLYSASEMEKALSDHVGGPALYAAMQQQSAKALVDEIRGAGGQAVAYEANLGDPDMIPFLFDRCEHELGPVDVLVCNHTHCVQETFDPARVSTGGFGVDRISAQGIDDHFAVNTRAVALLMSEYVSRYLLRRANPAKATQWGPTEWGRIINLSTDAAHAHESNVSYAASKHAIESYTRSAAAELGHYGITVNIVAPGPIQTGYLTPEQEQAVAAGTPLGRVGCPEDVADVILFLASEQARWITGQLLYVGGGWRMGQ
jgi:3-oxoacyl-[acyl-carrier protein] reductase